MKKFVLFLLLLIPIYTLSAQVSGVIQISGVVQGSLNLNVSSLEYSLNLNGAQFEEIASFSLKANMPGRGVIVFSTQNNFALKAAGNPDDWKYVLTLVGDQGDIYNINSSNELELPYIRKGGKFSLQISYPSALQLNLFQGTYTDNLTITFKII